MKHFKILFLLKLIFSIGFINAGTLTDQSHTSPASSNAGLGPTYVRMSDGTSAVSIPTLAGQISGNASLSSILTALLNPLAVTGTFWQATQPVSIAGTVAITGGLTDAQLRATPVPISGTVSLSGGGDATAANQITGNNSLSSIDTKSPALGQALAAASTPVVLTAAQVSTLTPLSTVACTKSGTWDITNAGTFLTQAQQSGAWSVTANIGTVGALSTAANQSTEITALGTINTTLGTPFQAGGSIANTSFVATQGTGSNLHTVVDSGSITATGSGNFTVVQGTGTNLHVVTDSTSTTAVTQATATNLKAQAEVYQGGTAVGPAAPLQVSIANTGTNATAVKTDSSATTQPVSIAAAVPVTDNSGSLTVDAPVGTPAFVRLSDGTAAITTLPVSAASLPLAPLAATSTKQSDGSQKTMLVNVLGTVIGASTDGGLQIQTQSTAVFKDPFDGVVIDTTNAWNAAVTVTGGTVTQSTGALAVATTTAANSAAAITSQSNFVSYGLNQIQMSAAIKLEATSIITGVYRFYGFGTAGTSYSSTNPIKDGVGIDVTTGGQMRAVIYASDVLQWSSNLTTPTDGFYHSYTIIYRDDSMYIYVDGNPTPAAFNALTQPFTTPDNTVLPIRLAMINGGSILSGTPTWTFKALAIGDSGAQHTDITDGTYKFRKATVKAASTAAAASDTALVVAMSPNNGLVVTQGSTTSGQSGQLVQGAVTTANPAYTTAQTSPLSLDTSGNLRTIVGSDLSVTGQSAQTATVNNILTVASGSTATDLLGYRSGTVQVVSTASGGTYIFEGSNDNTNFQTIPVWSQLILTGTPVVAAITSTASQLAYTFPVQFRYIRLRIATTITGGSIQAFSKFSQVAWTPGIFQVGQATAANLNVTATGTITAVTTVTTLANGQTANSSAATGSPLRVGGIVKTTHDTTLASADAANLASTTDNALIVYPNAAPELAWQYAAAASGISNTTTAVTIKAAAAASIRNYINSCQLSSTALGVATEFAIRDGAAGTVIWRTTIPAAGILGGMQIGLAQPIKGTAATLLEVVTLTASVTGSVYVNCQGFAAP